VTAVHVVVPDGVDDPGRPSGGNTYDRRLCSGLSSLGWSVQEHAIPGCWPRAEAAAFASLSAVVERIPDDTLLLLDGLVASTASEVLVPQAMRLRMVVLVHMPLGHDPPADAAEEVRMRERAVLASAAAVVTTSAWTRQRLLELYELPPQRMHVAQPAVDAAELSIGTAAGGALLCVAAVTFAKGHDVLVEALARARDLPWHCVCVGSLERDPAFVQAVGASSLDSGLAGRVEFVGARTGADLDRSYADADLVVLASRAETYGMVVIEGLARGLPVIATEVGGVSEAVGHSADGSRPGLLVSPGDPAALAGALRDWLGDAGLRGRLRRAATERRESLPGWSTTASVVAGVLARASR
jgi:glycosyltransferase involved in cell wall biosynthesis